MYQPTIYTWVLILFGAVTLFPLFFAQLVMLIEPRGKRAKNILIGKGENWRNDTHFKSALGAAWADWLFFFPAFVMGTIGMLMSHKWGYALFGISGSLSVYINIILFFQEKEYVFPSRGRLQYYTYYWGNFVYWGIASLGYSIYRLI